MIVKVFSERNKYKRTEYIDTEKNEIFTDAQNLVHFEELYEAYWGGGVMVTKVEKANIKSRGKNWGIKTNLFGEMK